MKNNLDIIKKWSANNKNIGLARVVKTWGSSPRPVGSVMLINSDGEMAGSVSGGCVEGAVVKTTLQLLEDNTQRKLSYGVTDDEAWSVGLSCGGSIEVYVQSVDFSTGIWEKLWQNLENNKSSIMISEIGNGNRNALIEENGEALGDQMPKDVIDEAKNAHDARTNKILTYGDSSYFIQIFPRKSILLIIGAAHVTVDLVALGNRYDFDTIVIDPRGYFVEKTIFVEPPTQLIEAYPSEVLANFPLDAYTYCAILSHDPKIDDNALEVLLDSKVAYIGALGSRKTHEKRSRRLTEKGITQSSIDRIKAPIGVNIHAKSAQEIALSIMGQIISIKNQA